MDNFIHYKNAVSSLSKYSLDLTGCELRIYNNIDKLLTQLNVNLKRYDIYHINYFKSLLNQKISSNYDNLNFVLIGDFFNIEHVVKPEIDNAEYINGIIKEAFIKKDFFLIKRKRTNHPIIHNECNGVVKGIYENVKLLNYYPYVEL